MNLTMRVRCWSGWLPRKICSLFLIFAYSKNEHKKRGGNGILKKAIQNGAFLLWLRAAGVRAARTAVQSALAAIGAAAVFSAVDWRMVLSTAALSAVLSVLTSVAGIPEVDRALPAESTSPRHTEN